MSTVGHCTFGMPISRSRNKSQVAFFPAQLYVRLDVNTRYGWALAANCLTVGFVVISGHGGHGMPTYKSKDMRISQVWGFEVAVNII